MTYTKQPIYCKLSGVQIGTLELLNAAGKLPYAKAWQATIVQHPVFSLEPHKLLAFSRAEWRRLAKPSLDGETTEKEDAILRICFLAVLHSLGSIKQELPALPPLHVVQTNFKALFSLAYWKFYLDSKRFAFPKYRISKSNANADFANIKDYFEICFDMKLAYESEVQSIDEGARIAAADRALKKLKSSWIAPPSNKELWKWVRSNLPAKYEADAQGWMATIFLGKEKAILQFDKDEIQLLIDIVISECPPGTGMLHAVEARLNEVQKIWEDNKEAFTVDFEEFELEAPLLAARADSKAPDSLEAPKEKDFPSKIAFIKANALWYLQQRAVVSALIKKSISGSL